MAKHSDAQPDDATLAEELGEAIHERRLRLYYQPVVSLIDRVAKEVEALPRWPRNGDGEILAPPDFIGVADRFDLLDELERWAIETAFEQLSRWHLTDLRVALNFSEDHLYSTLAEEIRAAAQRHGIEPRRLTLEVSETVLLELPGGRLQRLRQLAEIGVGLTVDDYSGTLPAEALGRLPTTALKISRRVVAGIPDASRPTEVAAAAIRLAADLDLTVIANGIESPGQLAALRDMGCQYGQGFLFSIPMPAEVLAERAARR